MVERTRIITGTYHGPTDGSSYQRDQNDCYKLWNREYSLPTFDELVATQIRLALREKRKDVVCLDVGVGKAGLYRSFLNQISSEKGEAFDLLQRNPQLQLHLVGFNDAPDESKFLEPIEARDIIIPYPNIHLNFVHHTLTRNQTLGQLLNALNLPHVDQVTATAALHYLSPQIFAAFMEDVIQHLRGHGSRFIGLGYCDYPVGLSVNNMHTVSLNVRELKSKKPDWRRTFQQKSDCFGDDCDLVAEKKALSQLMQVFLKSGVIFSDDIEQVLQSAYALMEKPFQPFEQTEDLFVLRAFVEDLIAHINKNIVGQRRMVNEIAKKDILSALKNKYREQVNLRYGHETIDIEKK